MNIQEIIHQIYSSRDKTESLQKTHERIAQHVLRNIQLDLVPVLSMSNYQQIKNGTLVRFDCMIQDIFDREIEYLRNDSPTCLLYGNSSSLTNDETSFSSSNKHTGNEPQMEEQMQDDCMMANDLCIDQMHDSEYVDIDILYTVPIPGFNRVASCPSSTTGSGLKVDSSSINKIISNDKHETYMTNNESISVVRDRKRKRSSSPMSDSNHLNRKRLLEEIDPQLDQMENDMNVPSNLNHSKKSKIDLYIPAENQTEAFPAIVKIYHQSKSSYKLASIITVLGILSHEQVYFEPNNEKKPALLQFHEEELHARLPSNNLVPRIYALSITNHDSVYTLYKSPILATSYESVFINEKMIHFLSKFLYNDRIAAQYLLLHLMSKVSHTNNQVLINKLSLNLHNLTTSEAESLVAALRLITPATVHVPVYQESLNNMVFYPVKNHEKNKIEGSMLQLAPGTHLILNETLLHEGEINQQGLANLNSLRKLISQQQLIYDFKFDNYDLPVEIPSLILSSRKSILHECVDVHLPIIKEGSSFDTSCHTTTNVNESHTQEYYDKVIRDHLEFLPHFKAVLDRRENQSKIIFPDNIKDEAQQSFVDLRKQYFNDRTQSIGASDMGRWITLSRTAAAFYNLDTVTSDIWKEIMNLEGEMRKRTALRSS